ncbi:MAG: HAMP domain-containing sensor histidine kinase [Gaiellales bacterium]
MRVSRVSLRSRLLLAVTALSAAGLVVAALITVTALKGFLVDRVDDSLRDAAHSLSEREGSLRFAAPGTAVQLRSLDGERVIISLTARPDLRGDVARPQLPDRIDPPAATDGFDRVRYLSVAGSDGDRYRVRASIEPGAEAMLVVATSLADVDSTVRRLITIEAAVTLVVLAALAALALWLVRVGLRPLDAIETTAAAIAAGDLTRRVERAEPGTEVGRLGLSLNGMLSQIETAFRAKEESEQTLRRFVADASHELRTPLAAVRAYAELFARGAADRPDDLARSMTGISRESERMSVLVDDLLLLARLDEGRPLEQEPVWLDALVKEAVETARMVDPERLFELAAIPVCVRGDEVRLRQVVDNLLANVRTHTPPGTSASVSLSKQDEKAVLTVTDDGPGFGDEPEQVFQRFYRADPSRARTSGGVGLGLAIVSAVVEAHQGSVTASSGPDGGAVVTVVLPLSSS